MIADTRPLIEITQDALRLLYRELGLVETVRFLNQFTDGFGNYTDQRRTWTESLTFEEAVSDIHAYQARRSGDSRDK